MGTMSRHQKKTQAFLAGRANPRATIGNRVQSGLFLRDMLAVIQYRERFFNRKVRRIVFSLWRRHCKGLGISVNAGVERYKGVKIMLDDPSQVSQRLLTRIS